MRDGLGRIQSLLVLGGGSDIALATVDAVVAEGTERVLLAARKPERLAPHVERYRTRGATVELLEFDAQDSAGHERLIQEAFAGGDLDLVLVAFGTLGPGGAGQRDRLAALDVLATNLVGAVSVILPVARALERQGHGTLAVLSSVAGQRGRAANYVYGASKAGLDTFCQGLGDALAGSGAQVMVVRPGFVQTKMTAGRPKPPLAATPDQVAAAIVDGLRVNAHTVWVPASMRVVSGTLRHLPRPLFRRLRL
ncbi:MAG TPA: SDR family NAD(P)-dependent oxidoreductase [Actinomycetota bacterium]|nr:SDR family NAD(P)-dependent oxidoreductase [Actinomycetota bacterium]